MDKKNERTIALTLGAVFAFLALELALRISGAGYQPLVVDDSLLKTLDAQDRTVVLTVGDSMTYGIGSTTHNDYPSQLERILNEREDRYLVVNAVMAGANSAMILEHLPGYLAAVHPKFVCLLAGCANQSNYMGYNDFIDRNNRLHKLEELFFKVRVFRLLRFAITKRQTQRVATDGMSASVDAYRRWLVKKGRPLTPTLSAGFKLLELNRFDEARALFESELQDGDDPDLLWAMGVTMFGLRDPSSTDYLERCVQAEPSNPSCYCSLGEPLVDSIERHDEAIALFKQGVAADPDFACNYWGLGMTYRRRPEQRALGLEAFKDCIKADPDELRCYTNIMSTIDRSQLAELAQWLEPYAKDHPVAADTISSMRVRVPVEMWVSQDLQRMIDLSREQGAQVVMMDYPARNPLNILFKQIAEENGLPFSENFSTFDALLRNGEPVSQLFIRDNAHCTDRGYGIMAKGVAREILQTRLDDEP